MGEIFDIQLLTSGIRLSTPLLLAALGGMFSERTGVVNIALDGIMIFGAFSGASVAFMTGNPWYGVLAAVLCGGLIAHIHGIASIKYHADQVISGTAINILAIGVPALFSNHFFGSTSNTPNIDIPIPIYHIPYFSDIPYIGELFGKHSVIVYAAFILAGVSYYVIFKTPFGLRIRAVGENPEAADAAGINVYMVRYYGVWISGLLAGLAGAYLSVAHGTSYVRNISAGRGFIALAALIFGRYHPKLTIVGCIIFGISDAMQIRMQSVVPIPIQFIQIFPYVLTMLILAGFIGKAYVPSSNGIPYIKE